MRRLLQILAVVALFLPLPAHADLTPGTGTGGGSGGIVGGTCPSGQFMSGINTSGVPVCSTPAGGGTGYPVGSTPQIGGFDAANNPEAETVSGDGTFSRLGSNSYGLKVTETNGTAFSALATAPSPLSIVLGGLASSTAPTTAQIPIAQSAASYLPETMNGDAAISSTGVVTVSKLNGTIPGGVCTFPQFVQSINASGVPTCATPSGGSGYPSGAPPQIAGFAGSNLSEAETVSGDLTFTRAGTNSYTAAVTKTNGVPFTALATAAVPLSVSNGGRGATAAPSAGQIDIAQSATAFAGETMSGDCTITSTGAITCLSTNGTLFTTFAPKASPSFTGTVTMPDASTFTSAGYNSAKAIGIGMAAPSTTGNLALSNTTSSSVYWGSTTTPSGSLTASPGSIGLGSGLHYNGTNWIADNTSASLLQSANNLNSFYSNTGLTVGNAFTPNPIAAISAAGFNLEAGVYQVNGTQIASANLGDVTAPTAFTPTIAGNTAAGTNTYSLQSGFYYTIGHLCNVTFGLTLASSSGMTGSLIVGGLPKPAASGSNEYQSCAIAQFSGVTLTANFTQVGLRLDSGNNYAWIIQNGSAQTGTNLGVGGISASSGQIIGSCTYLF